MMRKLIAISLLASLALAMPGSVQVAQAKRAKNTIKIATLAPRGSDIEKGFRKIDKKIQEATGGEWGIKFFPSGVAGDEKDVIRKMKAGQMDASIITTTGLSQIVREVAVLDAPGVIEGYKELDRVKKKMSSEWEKMISEKGYHLLAWGEGGQYRIFSKKPLDNINNLKSLRPWLWEESQVLKEIYKVVGATGVPLGLPEVYGALQTDMVDTVFGTSVANVGLQWWSKVSHVTADATGVLLFGMVMTNDRWNALPENVRKILMEEIKSRTKEDNEGSRKTDDRAYSKLLKKGYTAHKWEGKAMSDFEKVAASVRSNMVGRVFKKDLLDKVMKVAKGK